MKRFMKEMKQYWGFAVYSAKCDLKAEVANSFLNWLWWILEPMSSMIIYAVVFSVLMSSFWMLRLSRGGYFLSATGQLV